MSEQNKELAEQVHTLLAGLQAEVVTFGAKLKAELGLPMPSTIGVSYEPDLVLATVPEDTNPPRASDLQTPGGRYKQRGNPAFSIYVLRVEASTHSREGNVVVMVVPMPRGTHVEQVMSEELFHQMFISG